MINEVDYRRNDIIETWNAQSFRINNAIVNFKQMGTDEDKYIWIYFAYAPSGREFKRLVDEFSKRYYGIVEFKTLTPLLFTNHSEHQGNGIYRWKR